MKCIHKSGNSLPTDRSTLGLKLLQKSDHKLLEFISNLRKKLSMVKSSRILRWAIILMGLYSNIFYLKGMTVLLVGVLSRQSFRNKKAENHKNALGVNGRFLGNWVRQYSALSKTLGRINRNIWSNCSMAERPLKEPRRKLTIEEDKICNRDIKVLRLTLGKYILKSVHVVHWSITITESWKSDNRNIRKK